jgi:hypothetical protein
VNFPTRACPACGHRFVPWNLWRVSRWSCISCPSCKTKLNRNTDLQLFAIVGLNSAVLVALVLGAVLWFGRSPYVAVALAFVVMVVVGWLPGYLLDVATVRLVTARRWRGWLLGYTSKAQANDA